MQGQSRQEKLVMRRIPGHYKKTHECVCCYCRKTFLSARRNTKWCEGELCQVAKKREQCKVGRARAKARARTAVVAADGG